MHEGSAYGPVYHTGDSIVYAEQTDKALHINPHENCFLPAEAAYQPPMILFTTKESAPNTFEYHSVKPEPPDFTTFLTLSIILPGFVLAATIISLFRIPLMGPFLKLFDFKSSETAGEHSRSNLPEVLFFLLFFAGLIMWLFQIQNQLDFNFFTFSKLLNSVVFSAFILASFFVLKLSNLLLYHIFGIDALLQYNTVLNQSLSGPGAILFMLSAGSILAFPALSKILLVLSAALLAVSFIVKLIKYVRINSQNKLRFYYLFLYLCSLEIIPVLVIFRIISEI